VTDDDLAGLDRDRDVQECAAAICPAEHRRNSSPAEPPCGVCYGLADTVIAAWLALHPEGDGT